MALRVNAYPARPAVDAEFGYNMVLTFTTLSDIDFAAAGGANTVRCQHGWSTAENYSTGVLTLPAPHLASLERCAELGLKPCYVAAYGPPWADIGTLTLSADAPIGTTVLSVTGPLATIDPPFCHVMKPNGAQIVPPGRYGYYGALIHSVDVGAGTVTLAAATSVALVISDTLRVNRLRYSSLVDMNPNSVSVQGFLRYATFLAQSIADAGCEGYVCIWNETVWPDDPWESPVRFYDNDSPPPGFAAGSIDAIMAAALNAPLPDGVSFISGATDKSGGEGVVNKGVLTPTNSSAETLAVSHEGIHDYHNNPEGHGWDPAQVVAGQYVALHPVDDPTNFRHLAFVSDDFRRVNGFGPRPMATECGSFLTDDTRQAVYLLRRVISHWGMGVESLIYTLNDGNYPFDVAPGLVARPSYTALKNLHDLVERMDGSYPSVPSAVPTILGWADDDIPPMTVGIYGSRGHAVLFAWQRTSTPSASSGWETLTTPAPLELELFRPAGTQIAEAIRVRTGDVVAYSATATKITVDIDDDPIAIRLAPA